jgi:hypothetical protein
MQIRLHLWQLFHSHACLGITYYSSKVLINNLYANNIVYYLYTKITGQKFAPNWLIIIFL